MRCGRERRGVPDRRVAVFLAGMRQRSICAVRAIRSFARKEIWRPPRRERTRVRARARALSLIRPRENRGRRPDGPLYAYYVALLIEKSLGCRIGTAAARRAFLRCQSRD